MEDTEEAIEFYSHEIDLSWLRDPLPQKVTRSTMYSADRDIVPDEIKWLKGKFKAKVADWESGAISWICKINNIPLLILRGVTDIVDSTEGEAYNGRIEIFRENTNEIMNNLLDKLGEWINLFKKYHVKNKN